MEELIYFLFLLYLKKNNSNQSQLLFFYIQHRCVRIFQDKKTNQPTGFGMGSIEGRVAIHYVNPTNPKDNFTFKCHRQNGQTRDSQDIYAVSNLCSIFLLLVISEICYMFLYTICLCFQFLWNTSTSVIPFQLEQNLYSYSS